MIADVDQQQREEDEVRGGDVAGVVGQRVGLTSSATRGAALRPPVAGAVAREPAPQGLQLGAVVLGGHLELVQRDEQQRHPDERGVERELHVTRQVAAGGVEHARVDQRVGEPHGHEVQRHERAGDDREDGGVARLALRVLDREAQRLVGRVEQEHDQERDERRLVPHPPLAPRGLRPDRAGEQRADAEDQRQVDRDVGAQVVPRVAGAQVLDRADPADHEAAERHDRQRHVHVEDLLREALVGVDRRVERGQRERRGQHDRGGDSERRQACSIELLARRHAVSPRPDSRRAPRPAGRRQIVQREDRQPASRRARLRPRRRRSARWRAPRR